MSRRLICLGSFVLFGVIAAGAISFTLNLISMSVQTRFLPFTALAFFLMVCSVTAQDKAQPQNVLDFYLLLPKEELPALESTEKPRQAFVQHQDLANGYLEVNNPDLQGVAQVALFRRKNREALIGVAQIEQTVASTGSVKFLEYRQDKWSDVTTEVLPKVPDEEILTAYNRIKKGDDEARTLQQLPAVYWNLPKKGTTVELRCGEDSDAKDKSLLKFTWDGARFFKQAKQP